MKNVMHSFLLCTFLFTGQLFGAMHNNQPQQQQHSFCGTWAGKAKWIGWAAIPVAVLAGVIYGEKGCSNPLMRNEAFCNSFEQCKKNVHCFDLCNTQFTDPMITDACASVCNNKNEITSSTEEIKELILKSLPEDAHAYAQLDFLDVNSTKKILNIKHLSELQLYNIRKKASIAILELTRISNYITRDETHTVMQEPISKKKITILEMSTDDANKTVNACIELAKKYLTDADSLEDFLMQAYANKVLVSLNHLLPFNHLLFCTTRSVELSLLLKIHIQIHTERVRSALWSGKSLLQQNRRIQFSQAFLNEYELLVEEIKTSTITKAVIDAILDANRKENREGLQVNLEQLLDYTEAFVMGLFLSTSY